MTNTLPRWADVLLAVWVVVVGVISIGGTFVPAIGALTANAAAFYAIMVLSAVTVQALRVVSRNSERKEQTESGD